MTSAPADPGGLLCTILNAGGHWWSVRGCFNLYLHERALVVVSTNLTEMMEGMPKWYAGSHSERRAKIDEALVRQRAKAEDAAKATVAETLERHPDARFVSWSTVTAASLRKGLAYSRLALEHDDGSSLRRVWTHGDGMLGRLTPNAPFGEVDDVLHGRLGGKLASR